MVPATMNALRRLRLQMELSRHGTVCATMNALRREWSPDLGDHSFIRTRTLDLTELRNEMRSQCEHRFDWLAKGRLLLALGGQKVDQPLALLCGLTERLSKPAARHRPQNKCQEGQRSTTDLVL
jgi:hypothetical protein